MQKCKERLRTKDPKWSDPSPDPAQAGATCTGLPFYYYHCHGINPVFMLAMCIWLDGFVLLEGAGFTETVRRGGSSPSGTRGKQRKGSDAGKFYFLLHIFLLI